MSHGSVRVPLLVRLTYLVPLLEAIALSVLTFVPHLFFVIEGGGVSKENFSLASFAGVAWRDGKALLDGTTKGGAEAVRLAWLLVATVALFWLLWAVCMYFLCTVSIGSCLVYRYPIASRESNRTKRWLRFFCFGRGAVACSMLLASVASALPYALNALYVSMLGYSMRVDFFFLPDPVIMGLLTLIGLCLLFGTGSLQRRTHTDLFRLYRVKKEECDTNEDTV